MTEWNQYKGDPQHSGCRRDLEGPHRIETDWTAELTGPVGAPVLDRDTVFVGTERGNVYAVERDTGRRRWTLETLPATDATPVVTREHLFFGTDDGTVVAVDPATGDRQWETDLPGSLSTSLAHADGRVYAGHADGDGSGNGNGNGVTALEAATGEPLWTHETETAVGGCPAVATVDGESRVYAGTERGAVSGLEADTGDEAWTAPADGAVTAGPTVADGRVYVADGDGTLIAMDAGSGQSWFTYEIGDAFTSSATVLPDAETTFVGAADGYLHVTDTTFGRRKLRGWLFAKKGVPLDGPVRASPVVVGNVCCVADETGSLYGLDLRDDCSHLWHTAVDGAITSTPAVGAEQLFVGSDDGHLHCFTWTPGEPRP